MNSTFRLTPSTVLRVANNILLIDNGEAWTAHPPFPYIALVLETDHFNGPGEAPSPPTAQTLATLKPHEARALASAILSAATEAKS